MLFFVYGNFFWINCFANRNVKTMKQDGAQNAIRSTAQPG
jgi:hypothetical protein